MNEVFEIRKAKNGFVIFENPQRGPISNDAPFVFENIDNALKFLKDQFAEIDVPVTRKTSSQEKKHAEPF